MNKSAKEMVRAVRDALEAEGAKITGQDLTHSHHPRLYFQVGNKLDHIAFDATPRNPGRATKNAAARARRQVRWIRNPELKPVNVI